MARRQSARLQKKLSSVAESTSSSLWKETNKSPPPSPVIRSTKRKLFATPNNSFEKLQGGEEESDSFIKELNSNEPKPKKARFAGLQNALQSIKKKPVILKDDSLMDIEDDDSSSSSSEVSKEEAKDVVLAREVSAAMDMMNSLIVENKSIYKVTTFQPDEWRILNMVGKLLEERLPAENLRETFQIYGYQDFTRTLWENFHKIVMFFLANPNYHYSHYIVSDKSPMMKRLRQNLTTKIMSLEESEASNVTEFISELLEYAAINDDSSRDIALLDIEEFVMSFDGFKTELYFAMIITLSNLLYKSFGGGFYVNSMVELIPFMEWHLQILVHSFNMETMLSYGIPRSKTCPFDLPDVLSTLHEEINQNSFSRWRKFYKNLEETAYHVETFRPVDVHPISGLPKKVIGKKQSGQIIYADGLILECRDYFDNNVVYLQAPTSNLFDDNGFILARRESYVIM